jgi:hypothetical protein
MKTSTRIKSGTLSINHNQKPVKLTVKSVRATRGAVKSGLRAGAFTVKQTTVRDNIGEERDY